MNSQLMLVVDVDLATQHSNGRTPRQMMNDLGVRHESEGDVFAQFVGPTKYGQCLFGGIDESTLPAELPVWVKAINTSAGGNLGRSQVAAAPCCGT